MHPLRAGHTVNHTATLTPIPHSLVEDALALLVGTLLVSFGVILLRDVGALTGGTAGLAFLIHYTTGLPFGLVFFAINVPFYYLAIRRMGWSFTVKTFCAVTLVSVFSGLQPLVMHIEQLQPFYAAGFGGVLIGLGMVVLFRHRASLGGVNILALYLQDGYGIRAGKFQMVVDLGILVASLFVVSLPMMLASILGAFVLNLIIAMNHRPNRYLA